MPGQVPESGAGVDEDAGPVVVFDDRCGGRVDGALGDLLVVDRQHRDAVGVDAGEVGVEHHLGADLSGPRIGPERAHDLQDLLPGRGGGEALFAHRFVSCHASSPEASTISRPVSGSMSPGWKPASSSEVTGES